MDITQRAYYEASEIESFGEAVYSSILYSLLDEFQVSGIEADHAASHLGKAQGIVAFLRTALPLSNLHQDPGLPLDILARFKISQNDTVTDPKIWSTESLRYSVHEMADRANAHIFKSQQELRRLNMDSIERLFLPRLVVQRYLNLLEEVDFDLSRRELYRFDKFLPLRLAWDYYSAAFGLNVINYLRKSRLMGVWKTDGATDSDKFRPSFLSTEAAVSKLILIIDGKLEELKNRHTTGASSPSQERLVVLALVLLSAVYLPFGWRLVILTIIVLLVSIEKILYWRIDSLRDAEFISRLESIRLDLQLSELQYTEVREPPSGAINLLRVHRDDSWKLIPVNLTVEGDVVQISPEDRTGICCRRLFEEPGAPDDLFVVSEAPLRQQLSFLQSLRNHQCGTCGHEARVVCNYTCIFLIAVMLARPILQGLVSFSDSYAHFMFSMTMGLVVLSPIWDVIFFCYSNARVIALIEVLQKSKTPYMEAEDVDEFDEDAPPPTKNVYIHPIEILRKIGEAFFPSGSGLIFWSYDLAEHFARVSVLCYSDREGPIANSFPMPVEMAFPHPLAKGELAFGEFIVDPNNSTLIRTNYSDPNVNDGDLRAIGLSLMVSSSCGIHNGPFRREWHSRFPWDVHPGRNLDPVFRTCTCSLSRDLGFHASASTRYSRVNDFWIFRDIGISTALNPIEYQGLFSRLFLDKVSRGLHMFSFGDLTTTACLCRFTWNSRTIEPISDILKRKLIELDDNLAASDLQCIGLTYRPIVTDEGGLSLYDQMESIIDFGSIQDEGCPKEVSKVAQNHIFLGTLISGYNPKEDMQELIDDLENGGIRFVYFSRYSESITKAFGDRLGLETDWNSCIILSKPSVRTDRLDPNALVSEFTDPKSKLPRGVHNIRPHLESVDDIPLHISLFAECEPSSVAEMLKIYAEYDEYVIVVGSSLNWSNSEIFSQAHCPVAMEPANLRTINVADKIGSMQLGAALTALTCPIILPFDSSPYVLTEIIREARSLFRGDHLGLVFRLDSAISMTIVSLFSPISSPTILFANLLAWMTTFSFLFAPYEPDLLKLMPMRFWVDRLKYEQLCFYLSQPLAFSAVLLLTLRLVGPKLADSLICLSYFALGATSLHSYLPLWRFGPLNHPLWTASMTVIFLSVTWFSLVESGLHFASIGISLSIIFLAAASIIVACEYAKFLWRQLVQNSQKRARLLFNTKLGMHSPV